MSANDKIAFEIFGSSHAECIGVRMDGVRFGEHIDLDALAAFMQRRRAKEDGYSTPRIEADEIVFESGVENGITTGEQIIAKIYNTNVKRSDYSSLKDIPRPSHADYVARVKYGNGYEATGGGSFSGRMTAPMCIAGGIALQILQKKGVYVGAYVQQIGGAHGPSYKDTDVTRAEIEASHASTLPALSDGAREDMLKEIFSAKKDGDSVGGVVECCVFGLPVGCGGLIRAGLESEIARNVYAIPAVKGVEFGAGFDISSMRGSQANDSFYFDGDEVKTRTNNSGGINGGLANGMPLLFRVAFRPTPSISKPQSSVNLATREDVVLQIKGRHDACFVPRAVPVVEAMAALALINHVLK